MCSSDLYTPQKDNQSLPGWFSSKFPGLCGLLHLFRVHGIVHHARNFYVAPQGQPTDAIFSAPNLLLDQGKPRIKKEVKLFYTRFERNSRQKMAELVQDDKQRKAQDKLEDLYGHNQMSAKVQCLRNLCPL